MLKSVTFIFGLLCVLSYTEARPTVDEILPLHHHSHHNHLNPDDVIPIHTHHFSPASASSRLNSKTIIGRDGKAITVTDSRSKTYGDVSANVHGETSGDTNGVKIGSEGETSSTGHGHDAEGEAIHKTTGTIDHKGEKIVKSMTGTLTEGDALAAGNGKGHVQNKDGNVIGGTTGATKSIGRGAADSVSRAMSKYVPPPPPPPVKVKKCIK